MVFIGYVAESKAYQAYDPRTGRVHVTQDVVFDELAQWDWGENSDTSSDLDAQPFHVEHYTTMEFQQAGVEPEHGSAPAPSVAARTPSPPPTPRVAEIVSPPSTAPELDADHDDAPLRFWRVDNILGPTVAPGLAKRTFHDELHVVSTEEPSSLEEAVQDPSWRTAMVDELRSIEENKTWDIANLPAGHHLIGLKWVYKAKRDEGGCIVKHKARLVAKGYVQKQGVDFKEVYAPVARMESVHLILAVTAHEGWRVHRWRGASSVEAEQSTVWAPSGTAHMVRQVAHFSEFPWVHSQQPRIHSLHQAHFKPATSGRCVC
jgi:hypothetical protein